MVKVVEKWDEREAGEELLRLDEIAREGARRMWLGEDAAGLSPTGLSPTTIARLTAGWEKE